jgi:hypothetical protein
MKFEETNKQFKYQTYFNLRYPITMAQSKCKDSYYKEVQKAKAEEDKNSLKLAPKPWLTYQ